MHICILHSIHIFDIHVFIYTYMLIYFCGFLVGQPIWTLFISPMMPSTQIRVSQGLTKLPGIKHGWVPGLVNYQFAMENGPFIDGLPIKHDDFP